MTEYENTLRILHISTEKQFRGGERQLVWLHEAILKQNISSYIVCRENSALASMNIENTLSHSFYGYFDVFGLILLLKKCHSIQPEIIHCHDSRAFTYGTIVSLFLKKKIIYTRKTMFPIHPSFLNKFKFRRCSHIIAISTAVLEKCKKVVLDNTNVSCIPDGVIVPVKTLSKIECRHFLKIPQHFFLIGTVAYFTPEKNISLVFNLASSLQKIFPNVRIACIGYIPKEVLQEVEKCENILTTGIIEHIEMYYSAFDLYISTSTQEGLGSALLDALVRNIPSIAMDSGGAKDLFGENNPMLIPPFDNEAFVKTVIHYINHTGYYEKYAKTIGDYSRKNFSIESMVCKYRLLYESLR